jgi:hypothetical protein
MVDGRPGTIDSGELTAEDRRRVNAFISLTAEKAENRLKILTGAFNRANNLVSWQESPLQ